MDWSWLAVPAIIFVGWFMNARNDERDAAIKRAVESLEFTLNKEIEYLQSRVSELENQLWKSRRGE